jgi:hypothetical protein
MGRAPVPTDKWDTLAIAKWGACAGVLYAAWQGLSLGGWSAGDIAEKLGGLLGGAIGGAALAAFISGARNLFVR